MSLAFGGPVHARRLVGEERMSDSDRSRGDALKSPRAYLERYIVLRYSSVALARAAQELLARDTSVATTVNNKSTQLSWTPNDPYFAPYGSMPQAQYQWGMEAMNFSAAWDVVRGNAYIGVLEISYPGLVSGTTVSVHPDLVSNYRKQFSPGDPYTSHPLTPFYSDHAIHVSGIIGALSNNASGVAATAALRPSVTSTTPRLRRTRRRMS